MKAKKPNIIKLLSKLALAGMLLAVSVAYLYADSKALPDPLKSTGAISLAGSWRFGISGTNAETIPHDLAGKIRLPGTMDDAGLGTKNTTPPTLEGPYRLSDYAGPAWYERDIDIPAGWQGKRVTLFLERCRWVTTVWLDGIRIGSQDSLIAPHFYDFGVRLAPGKHRLTICVDNTLKIDLGRFVSALRGGTWGNMNGIIGRIELAGTPPVWIDDVQVYPDVEKKQARVVVKIGNATGRAGHGTLIIGAKGAEATWEATGGQAEAILDMRGAKLWDEFSPSLSELTVKLGEDQRTVRFGMRKFMAKGKRFTMNDRPLLLRGTLECSVNPLTGYPPMDVAAWARICRIIKSYGLNFVRFHSWCPPEAAFAAADKEGIMIQAEAPLANVFVDNDPKLNEFMESEIKRMVDMYGNHPSFCLMTLGNEYSGRGELLTHWVDLLIQRDPRHLYSCASASTEANKTQNRQWTEGGSGEDARPTIAHEAGQITYFPDFKEIPKWTGVMVLKNFEMIREDMTKKHLVDLAPKYVEATGRHATLLYKDATEELIRAASMGVNAGFSLLDLHDYPTQGTALVGLLDPFWDSKGFVTPEAFRRNCGPTVPLLQMPKRAYFSDETFEAKAEVAHFGPAALPNTQPIWNIKDPQGRELASGKLPSLSLATGTLTGLGEIKASLASVSTPSKLTVTVALQGTQFANTWEIWVYPSNSLHPVGADVVVCDGWNDTAKSALAGGGKVFVMTTAVANSLRGSFRPVFWSPVWYYTSQQIPNTMGILCDPKHPAFSLFPTEMNSNWQWVDLIDQSRSLNLESTPANFRPLVQVVDNFGRNQKWGILFEARVGKGRLLVCTINLQDNLNRRPAAKQLLASLYAYLDSDKFQPTQELSPKLLEDLLANPSSVLSRLGAKVIQFDSEDPDHRAVAAIDGDPGTFWHTKWNPVSDPMPHEIVIDMGRELELKGVTYLPRQQFTAGHVAECAVYCGNDPSNWGDPAATAKFPDEYALQKIDFRQPAKGRYLKFKVLSGGGNQPFATVAEIDVEQTTSTTRE